MEIRFFEKGRPPPKGAAFFKKATLQFLENWIQNKCYKIHSILYKNIKNSKWLNFDLHGSKLDDSTTNRTISTRSVYLRRWFNLVITFATCVQFRRFDNRLKEESQGFQSVIESLNFDTCSESYGQIETWSWIARSRRDQSIGCQIVQFGPM